MSSREGVTESDTAAEFREGREGSDGIEESEGTVSIEKNEEPVIPPVPEDRGTEEEVGGKAIGDAEVAEVLGGFTNRFTGVGMANVKFDIRKPALEAVTTSARNGSCVSSFFDVSEQLPILVSANS